LRLTFDLICAAIQQIVLNLRAALFAPFVCDENAGNIDRKWSVI